MGTSSNPSALSESSAPKRSTILDRELVCLDDDGQSLFTISYSGVGSLDSSPSTCLHCDGQDLTYSPLVEHKQLLRAILPKNSQSALYCDQIEAAGEELLFALACTRDLEGIVAKHKFGPYRQDSANACEDYH